MNERQTGVWVWRRVQICISVDIRICVLSGRVRDRDGKNVKTWVVPILQDLNLGEEKN